MTDRRNQPITRCRIAACPYVGRWGDDQLCPGHASDDSAVAARPAADPDRPPP